MEFNGRNMPGKSAWTKRKTYSAISICLIACADHFKCMWRTWLSLACSTLFASGQGVVATPTTNRPGDAWSDPRNPITQLFGGKRLDLWSLQPVRVRAIPTPDSAREPLTHPADRFLDERLRAKGLRFAAPADRRTLIRRVTLDLTGLPPTPEAVEHFLRDTSPDAYEVLVDHLLASPRHGEHQARLWLDVLRYSDSNGFDWDEFRPQAWRFRDYFIHSLNRDKPFARLIQEMLAGDELLDGPPRDAAEQEALLGTGYLRLGPQDNAAPLFNEQERARSELMSDLVETTGSAFLALTFACCRCHDHKYDPLSQEDHYRMRAFFEAVKYGDDTAIDDAATQAEIRSVNAELEQRIEPLNAERTKIRRPVRDQIVIERQAKLDPEERALLEGTPAQPTAEVQERVKALRKKLEPSEQEVVARLPAEALHRSEALDRDLQGLRRQLRFFTHGLLMFDAEGAPKPTHVLAGGNHQQPRQAVVPGFISALDPNPAALAPVANKKSTGRRTALARWIGSPTNPLTARVVVNRAWQQHFGRGLVETANDFGLAGARPTHPELLDWLAADFVRHGGSLKRLHRLLVTSVAYRQSSLHLAAGEAVDPGNTLLWRQNPRRLSAEQLRDTVLSTAGLLQITAGGPPVWPDLPAEVLQANPAFLDDNETRTKGWYPSPPLGQYVRSVYLVQKKTLRVPLMEVFDLPENSTSCARRTDSTVAPQALTLLNDPLITTAARALAARVGAVARSGEPAIRETFRLAFQRSPTPAEMSDCQVLLAQRPLADLCRAILNVNEFVYVD